MKNNKATERGSVFQVFAKEDGETIAILLTIFYCLEAGNIPDYLIKMIREN